jgi:hypothetical protein
MLQVESGTLSAIAAGWTSEEPTGTTLISGRKMQQRFRLTAFCMLIALGTKDGLQQHRYKDEYGEHERKESHLGCHVKQDICRGHRQLLRLVMKPLP